MDKKIFLKLEIGLILIDLNQIFSMTPAELEIYLSIESYDRKNCKKLPKQIRFRKAHGFQTKKDIYSKSILIAQIKDLKQDCVTISRPYL